MSEAKQTIVIQSFRSENQPEWIRQCLESVSSWASENKYSYHCADDAELLSLLSPSFIEKIHPRWAMLCDLGRLIFCKKAIEKGYHRTVWLDADVFIAQPDQFKLPTKLTHGYAFGKEVWVEKSGKIRRGIHNAFCIFEDGNSFLDFYIHACKRIIDVHDGAHLAPQLLGPKFLKAQHPMLNFELLPQVAMLSPSVTEDIISGSGKNSELQREHHSAPAFNLCHSLLGTDESAALSAIESLRNGALS